MAKWTDTQPLFTVSQASPDPVDPDDEPPALERTQGSINLMDDEPVTEQVLRMREFGQNIQMAQIALRKAFIEGQTILNIAEGLYDLQIRRTNEFMQDAVALIEEASVCFGLSQVAARGRRETSRARSVSQALTHLTQSSPVLRDRDPNQQTQDSHVVEVQED